MTLPTSSRHATRRGQRLHEVTSRSSAFRAAVLTTLPFSSSLQRPSVVALVVVAIRPGADRLPPPGVVAIPLHRPGQSFLEAHLRAPPERFKLGRGERVAAVVPGTIRDELDQ